MEFLLGINGMIMGCCYAEFATMLDSQARIQKVLSGGGGSKTQIYFALVYSYFTGRGDRGFIPIF